MRTALTNEILTRGIAWAVIVPRDQRMSWQVAKNYSSTGGQEEQV
jgi:hypothetical protein